jgi:cytochrome c oxidase assembly factor CtaG
VGQFHATTSGGLAAGIRAAGGVLNVIIMTARGRAGRGFRWLWAPMSTSWPIMGGATGHYCRPGRAAGGWLEIKVSAATATPGERNVTAPPGPPSWRRWLAAAGLVLVLACLVPPLSVLARRYVLVESIQFSAFAVAGPALIVLGAPWRLLHLSGPAGRLAAAHRGNRSFPRAGSFLLAFIGVCLAWRLPPVMDALARQPALVIPQAVTLLAAGSALWLELVDSPPVAPRLPRPQRAAVAALAMWSIWIVAYVLGSASHGVFSAYDAAGSGLSAVADQEIAVGLVWAVAGCCFVPVVMASMLGWLAGGEDADEEFQRVFRDENERAMVRGWGTRPRRRPPSSA